jgi:hypothetical protein
MDSRTHATKLLPKLLHSEDEPADEPDCFGESKFIPDVDDVDGYNKYIEAELMFGFLEGQGWSAHQELKH